METKNKYQNGKIYKIVSPSHPELVYYGSTINKLCKRMYMHRTPLNRNTSKQIIEKGDAIILLVEDYPCENKEQLNRKEGWYILNHECVNKIVAGRTHKEYREANKQQINDHAKEYYEANKEKLNEKCKTYQKANKEQILKQRKEYYEANKEKLSKQRKEYYEANKEKLNKQRKE